MKVALPVWDGRISPVFDTARKLLLVDVAEAKEAGRSEEDLGVMPPPQRAAKLVALGVHVLVCGAISRPLASMVAAYGIQVIPFVSGEAEDVLSAYVCGRLRDPGLPPQFLMPGCRGRHRRFRGGRGGKW